MKTNELIGKLVADHAAQSPRKPIAYHLVMAIVGGLAVSAALLLITLGVRPDILTAFGTWRFDLKLGGSFILAIAAGWAALRLSRPTTSSLSAIPILLVPAVLLFVAVVFELATVPPAAWPSRAMGANGVMCLANIMALSVIPLVALTYALRWGAPMSPALMGAIAGMLAGALGATVFATHCTDDSPLFVAIWYVLAIGLMSMFGLVIGRHALRW
jgi:hypothetical protein